MIIASSTLFLILAVGCSDVKLKVKGVVSNWSVDEHVGLGFGSSFQWEAAHTSSLIMLCSPTP